MTSQPELVAWWKEHVSLLGKLVGDLLTLEMSARLLLAENQSGDDLSKTRPNLTQIREGDWVEITPLSDKSDLRQVLEKFNGSVKRKKPELRVRVDDIVQLRDALAHGRVAGYSEQKFGSYLKLIKFSKDKNKENKVQVTWRIDMSEEWFNQNANLLAESIKKVATALDFNIVELK